MCVCLRACVCGILLSVSLHVFLVKAIGDQWRLKVTNHPSSSHTALHVTHPHNPSISSPSLHHLSLYSVTKRGPLEVRVSFIFGAKAPDEGLQGIGSRGGQLLHCFNWHYHFSELTEMDHPARPQPLLVQERQVGGGVRGKGGRGCRATKGTRREAR